MKFEALSSQELKVLHEKNDGTVLLKIVFLLGAWALLGAAALSTPLWWVKLLSWIGIGFFLNGLVSLWHDSWHYTLFRKRSWNIVAGHLLGAIWGVMFGPSQHAHLAHHRFNRTLQDPDAYNAGKRSLFLIISYYVIIHFGFIMSITHYNVFYPLKYFTREEKLKHYGALVLLLLCYSLLFLGLQKLGWLGAAVDAWIIPLFFLNLWAGYKSVADHYNNVWAGDEIETATTVTSTGFWGYCWNGLNYHLEHHLYPQVPGYKLHKIHTLLREELTAKNALIYPSYFGVFLGCLKRGPTFIDEENNFFTLKKNKSK